MIHDLNTIDYNMNGKLLYTSLGFRSYPAWKWGGVMQCCSEREPCKDWWQHAIAPNGNRWIAYPWVTVANNWMRLWQWPWGGVMTTKDVQ
jgi:hypothetical protein